MTDEQTARDLLTAATEFPDELAALVQRLVSVGHRRRKPRIRLRAVTVGAATAMAVAAPPITHCLGPAHHAPLTQSGPSAANIARYHWSTLPPSPLGARSNPIVVMAGRELIELSHNRIGGTTFGAAFDSVSGRWHKIAPLPANAGFDDAATAWTGRQLFVIGLTASCFHIRPFPNCLQRAGLYAPPTNRWTTTLLPRAMDTLFRLAAVWNGHDIVLAAADSSHGRLGVASYDPATGRWQMITPVLPAGHPARFVAMVATSDPVILWSLWAREKFTQHGRILTPGVDVLALARNGTWRNVTGGWPQKRTVTSPVLTGQAILVSPGQLFCGVACSPQFTILHGYFADPATLRRTLIPLGPLGPTDPAFVWTGRSIIAINPGAIIGGPHPIRPDDMALYNPISNGWTRLPAPSGHPSLAIIPVWTGTELLALTNSGRLLAFRR